MLALIRGTELLDQLGIRYVIGGSLASSMYGDPRHTNDVDIVIDLKPKQVPNLLKAFQKEFYLDEVAVGRAMELGRAFNAIHFDSALKLDFYVSTGDAFTVEQLNRPRPRALLRDSEGTVNLASPENVILSKLRWHRLGGSASLHQLPDVAGIIRIMRGELDREYLFEWADKLGVRDLLEEVLNES